MNREDIRKRLFEILDSEGLQAAASWSGQLLASTDSDMRGKHPDPLLAENLIAAAAAHIGCLCELNLYVDALATGAMTVLTMLKHGVTPPHVALSYVEFIQMLAYLPQAVDQQTQGRYSEQFQLLGAQIAALAAASAKKFFPENTPETIARNLAQFEPFLASLPPERLTIEGRDINPAHAADIFTQAIVTLSPFIEE